MGFSVPNFNLLCNIWRNGNPVTNPPDVVAACNLALGKRSAVLLAYTSTMQAQPGGMYLLLPAGTDIRDLKAPAGADTVEVSAGSRRYYSVEWVDDAGGGFQNEHRFAEILGLGTWPVPFPRPAGGSSPLVIPLAFHASLSGLTDTIAINAPAGSLIVVYGRAMATGGGLVPTSLVSSLVGPVASFAGGGGTSYGAVATSCQGWAYITPGGAETLTIGQAVPSTFHWAAFAVPAAGVDVWLQQGFASLNPNLHTAAPTTHPLDSMVAMVACEDESSPHSYLGGIVRFPGGFDLVSTVGGIDLCTSFGSGSFGGPGTPGFSVGVHAIVPFAGDWILGCFA